MNSPDFLKPPGSSASNPTSAFRSVSDSRGSRTHSNGSRSNSSTGTTTGASPIVNPRDAMRTIPPWISSHEEPDSSATSPPPLAQSQPSQSLPSSPLPSNPPHPTPLLMIPPKPPVKPVHKHTPADNTSSNSSNSNLRRRISRDGFIDYVSPPPAQKPSLKHFRRRLGLGRSEHGRRWDHARSAEPVVQLNHSFLPEWVANDRPTWGQYLNSVKYSRRDVQSHVESAAVLDRLQPTFNQPAAMPPYTALPKTPRIAHSHSGTNTSAEHSVAAVIDSTHAVSVSNGGGGSSQRSRSIPYQIAHVSYESEKPQVRVALGQRIWDLMIGHSMVPLCCRLMALCSSIISLAIAVRIFRVSGEIQASTQASRSQSLVVIIVDTIAVPWICYMTYDEYTGKPLGLRSPTHKVLLILSDLIFIIFKSASTSLAFEYLVSHANEPDVNGYMDPKGPELLRLSKSLAAFVVIGLIAWTLTLVINILRIVDRLADRRF
ncbi:hypothetical protein Cpir12675_003236 [Ceratocystis pirilliformis]|uniref:Regulator of phospholipase D SRF1 n=1 Tax=Ceratocystis pirilliformis TaxID=259994 RepID=A0ABR3Z417_9PEZI